MCVCCGQQYIYMGAFKLYKLTYSIHTQSCGVKQIDVCRYLPCLFPHTYSVSVSIYIICTHVHNICMYIVCAYVVCTVSYTVFMYSYRGQGRKRVSYC